MKKIKKIKLIVFLFTLFVFTACPKVDYKHSFRFTNNASHGIYIFLKIPNEDDILYPDTTIAFVRSGVPFGQGEIRHYSYNYLENELDTLILFIFDADIFDTYSWEEIRSDYKILQRYDIKFGNIKTLKYNLSYPPDETMKDMKMYPPFGND